jgi:hypothetical protein
MKIATTHAPVHDLQEFGLASTPSNSPGNQNMVTAPRRQVQRRWQGVRHDGTKP